MASCMVTLSNGTPKTATDLRFHPDILHPAGIKLGSLQTAQSFL
jgi:hypothetical protein